MADKIEGQSQSGNAKSAVDKSLEQQEKIAEASAQAMERQAFLELQKSLAEMQAKGVKSMGESLKGLA
jgi:hypothetical protein